MHTCPDCGREFDRAADRAVHREACRPDELVCRVCGERFPEASATEDGWRYRCPVPDCDGAGLGTGLRRPGRSPLTR